MSDELAVARPFADWLREQGSGRLHDELSTRLHELVQAVRDTHKKGTLTLQVAVSPLKDNVDVLVVTDEVKVTEPKPERKASMFYPDRNGNLSRTDPNQLEFESLREVVTPTTQEQDLKDA